MTLLTWRKGREEGERRKKRGKRGKRRGEEKNHKSSAATARLPAKMKSKSPSGALGRLSNGVAAPSALGKHLGPRFQAGAPLRQHPPAPTPLDPQCITYICTAPTLSSHCSPQHSPSAKHRGFTAPLHPTNALRGQFQVPTVRGCVTCLGLHRSRGAQGPRS